MGIETSKHINTIKNVMSDEHAKDYASFSKVQPSMASHVRRRKKKKTYIFSKIAELKIPARPVSDPKD